MVKNRNILFFIFIFLIMSFALSIIFLIDTNIAYAEESYVEASGQDTLALASTSYNIYYVLDGGTNSSQNPASISTDASTFYLQPASKSGYKFLGWYKDSNFESYIEKVKPSTLHADLTLYALFSEYISLPCKYSYTDFYNAYDDVEGCINCYFSLYAYYYEDLSSVSSLVSNHTTYTVYSESNTALTIHSDLDGDYSLQSDGIPSYIRITSDPFYTITYELNDGSLPSTPLAYNYYYKRADIASNLVTPTKTGYHFEGWYLDSEFTISMYSSAFTPHDITLYAYWCEIFTIEATITTTDFFSINTQLIDTIDYYNNSLEYVYSDNFGNLSSLYTEYAISIYDNYGNAIPYYYNEGRYASDISNGTPAYIKYDTPAIYSISYVLGEGASISEETPLFNYYTKRVDLKGNNAIPTKPHYIFEGWYLNEAHTETIYSSSFVPQNIVLYANWDLVYEANVYYSEINFDLANCELLGQCSYSSTASNEYSLGNLSDTTSGLPYYLKQQNADSYATFDFDNNEMHTYTNEGILYAQGSNGILNIFIYASKSIKFYVNGRYMYETKGDRNDQIQTPDFIRGFIGENYDAAHIGRLTIGKSYALYIMKGWSLTDSSDITWFDETSIALIDTTITYGELCTTDRQISLYAYMTFYGKLNQENATIDYDKYIEDTHGIITSASYFSLDDLMQEHVTEASSGSQKTNLDKLLKYLKLDTLGSKSLDFIRKLLNGSITSFSDFWDNNLGKILIISCGIAALVLIIINLYNFAKAISNIQSHS